MALCEQTEVRRSVQLDQTPGGQTGRNVWRDVGQEMWLHVCVGSRDVRAKQGFRDAPTRHPGGPWGGVNMGEAFRVRETIVGGGAFSFSARVSSLSKGSSHGRRSETRTAPSRCSPQKAGVACSAEPGGGTPPLTGVTSLCWVGSSQATGRRRMCRVHRVS